MRLRVHSALRKRKRGGHAAAKMYKASFSEEISKTECQMRRIEQPAEEGWRITSFSRAEFCTAQRRTRIASPDLPRRFAGPRRDRARARGDDRVVRCRRRNWSSAAPRTMRPEHRTTATSSMRSIWYMKFHTFIHTNQPSGKVPQFAAFFIDVGTARRSPFAK